MSYQSENPDEIRQELDLVRKLSRLSKTCWSPTLRANAKALETRVRQLQGEEQRIVRSKTRKAG